jgi:hypothetical protein
VAPHYGGAVFPACLRHGPRSINGEIGAGHKASGPLRLEDQVKIGDGVSLTARRTGMRGM